MIGYVCHTNLIITIFCIFSPLGQVELSEFYLTFDWNKTVSKKKQFLTQFLIKVLFNYVSAHSWPKENKSV